MAKMTDCIGKFIKVSPRSITIKDDNNKTHGIVRDVVSLDNIQPKYQFEYSSKLKKGGLVQGEIMEHTHDIVIKDKELYYLYNVHTREKYSHLFPEAVEKDEAFAEKIKNAGVTVIECFM